jgi:cytochrome c oxidase cbb3-type subunit III
MRLISLTLTSVFLIAGLGCRDNRPNSVAVGSAPTEATSVGPVPGGVVVGYQRLNPYGNDPVALQDGYRLFNWYNCSGCHGGHAGGGMGPSLRDNVWLYGSRDDQIFSSIAQGRSNGMPSWGSRIPEDQIWQITAYIKSMRTPQEPDPPVEPANEQVPNPADNTATGSRPGPQ